MLWKNPIYIGIQKPATIIKKMCFNKISMEKIIFILLLAMVVVAGCTSQAPASPVQNNTTAAYNNSAANPVEEQQQPGSGLGGVQTIEPPPQTNETQQPNETQAPAAYFRIEGDDYILAPDNVTAKKGGNVTIEFYVRTSGVYYGGLQFNSSYFDTGAMKKGESKNVSFVADRNFTFTSYWPASKVRKADGYFEVL